MERRIEGIFLKVLDSFLSGANLGELFSFFKKISEMTQFHCRQQIPNFANILMGQSVECYEP
jgi:hypothetical protein